ncbi:MAG: acyltransferase [Pseudomonadota bacterium]
MPASRPQQLVQLQALRAYAAVIVALVHILHDLDQTTGTHYFYTTPFDLKSGVDLFFVLSGFIIVYVSAPFMGEVSYRPRFLFRRLTRIAPAYWLYTSLMAIIVLGLPQLAPNTTTSPIHMISSYLFLPWPAPDGALGPILGVGWTLLYEMMFYLVFSLMIGLRLWRAIAATGAVFLSLIALRFSFGTSLPFYLDYWSNPIILEFLAGAVIGGLFVSSNRRFSWPLGAGLITLAFAWLVGVHQIDALKALPRVIALGVPSAAIVFAMTMAAERLPMGLSQPRWLVRIGDSSYSLYLSHFFAIGAGVFILEKSGVLALLPAWAWITPLLGLCIAVGLLSYYLFEKPLMDAARRVERSWLSPKPDRPQTSLATRDQTNVRL